MRASCCSRGRHRNRRTGRWDVAKGPKTYTSAENGEKRLKGFFFTQKNKVDCSFRVPEAAVAPKHSLLRALPGVDDPPSNFQSEATGKTRFRA